MDVAPTFFVVLHHRDRFVAFRLRGIAVGGFRVGRTESGDAWPCAAPLGHKSHVRRHVVVPCATHHGLLTKHWPGGGQALPSRRHRALRAATAGRCARLPLRLRAQRRGIRRRDLAALGLPAAFSPLRRVSLRPLRCKAPQPPILMLRRPTSPEPLRLPLRCSNAAVTGGGSGRGANARAEALPRRAAYAMTGEALTQWAHALFDIRSPGRLSLTFRLVRA